MNHIHRITQERDDALATIREAREQLMHLQHYLTSSKFAAPDADYVHVRTDILPKISAVSFTLIEG
jgi:hypothetical protein